MLLSAAISCLLVACLIVHSPVEAQVIVTDQPIDHDQLKATVEAAESAQPQDTAIDATAHATTESDHERLGFYGWLMLVLGPALVAAIAAFRAYRLPKRSRVILVQPSLLFGLLLLMLLGEWVGLRLAAVFAGIELSGESLGSLTLREQALLVMGGAAGQLPIVVLYALAMRRARLRFRTNADWPIPRAAIFGAFLMIAGWPIVTSIGIGGGLITTWITGTPVDPLAHDTLRQAVASRGDPWLVVIAALVIVVRPIMEELMYRGMLQTALRQLLSGPWTAIIVTSVVFSLMHLGNSAPHAIVALIAFSILLGWALEKSGRLITPIVMHMLFNMVNLALALWMVE